MVILLGNGKGKENKEIYELLSNSEKTKTNGFTVLSLKTISNCDKKRGVVIVTDDRISVKSNHIPSGFIGICDGKNGSAVKLFKESGIEVITCGMGNKNSATVTSISDGVMHIATQRSFLNINGQRVEPTECSFEVDGEYSPFSLMAVYCVNQIFGVY